MPRSKGIFRLVQTPVYYYLLPVFLLLHIENAYSGVIRYEFVYGEIASLLIWTVAIVIMSFWLFRKDHFRQHLFAFVVLFIFFFFCDIKDYLFENYKSIGRYIILLPACLLVIIAAYILIRKAKRTFFKLTSFLNLLLITLVLFEIISIFFVRNSRPVAKETTLQLRDFDSIGAKRPDIYYILFDGYTSSNTLKSAFNYDNIFLDTFLQNRNFYQASHSQSNYNLTPYSMASNFSLAYYDELDTTKTYFLRDFLPGILDVYNAGLPDFFAKAGYNVINLSIFDIRNYPTKTPSYNLWRIGDAYSRHNMFRKILDDIGWLLPPFFSIFNSGPTRREYVEKKDQHFLQARELLKETINDLPPGPGFVYGHFVLPHPASYLDSTGTTILKDVELPTDTAAAKVKYTGYVGIVNQTIKEIVSLIRANGRESVIILQGDHGFKFPGRYAPEHEFSNLSAFYFPDGDYSMLYPTVSNVNTFRIILNKYFNQDLQLLEDKTFFLKYR